MGNHRNLFDMKATTKFDIGDRVWFLRDNQAMKLDVTSVVVSIEGDNRCAVSYSLHYTDTEIPERELFASKEELLASL